MIPKPDYLTGEVKPFEDISPFIFYHGLASQIHPLYLQPFTPDMITEYFEGWEFISKIEYFSKLTDTLVYCSNSCGGKMIWVVTIKGDGAVLRVVFCGENYFEITIKTLAQFISNCNQADIKLTWRNKE